MSHFKTRKEMEKSIAVMRSSNDDVLEYLNGVENGLMPYGEAIDEMCSLLDDAIFNGDTDTIVNCTLKIRNLRKFNDCIGYNEIVCPSADFNKIICSDDKIQSVYKKCKKILK